MPGGLLRAGLVHRGHRAGAGAGADHAAAAHPDRRGDRGRGPLGDRGRRRPWRVVADRAPRVRRPRRSRAGRAGNRPGCSVSTRPAGESPGGSTAPTTRSVGAGRPMGHRVRRPGRRAGPARAARRPHRCRGRRLAVRAHPAVPRGGRVRGHRPGRGLRIRDPHAGAVAERDARGRSLPSRQARQRRADQGAPPRHLGPAGSSRPPDRPGVGQPAPAATGAGTLVGQEFRQDVEPNQRRGPERADPVRVDREGGTAHPARPRCASAAIRT